MTFGSLSRKFCGTIRRWQMNYGLAWLAVLIFGQLATISGNDAAGSIRPIPSVGDFGSSGREIARFLCPDCPSNQRSRSSRGRIASRRFANHPRGCDRLANRRGFASNSESRVNMRDGLKPGIIHQRHTLSRRINRQFSKEIREYAARTGLALWSWNGLHANMFLIFWFITARGHDFYHETAHSLWHAIQNDSTQREMLLKVAIAELADDQRLLMKIRWLITVTGKLGRYRNIAAHTHAIFSPQFEILPVADASAAREGARKAFNEIKHDQFWRALSGDLNALTLYARAIAFRILGWTPPTPLPHRPKLRSLEQIVQIENQINRLAQLEAHSLPQSPSRGKRKSSLSAAYVVKRGKSTNRSKQEKVR